MALGSPQGPTAMEQSCGLSKAQTQREKTLQDTHADRKAGKIISREIEVVQVSTSPDRAMSEQSPSKFANNVAATNFDPSVQLQSKEFLDHSKDDEVV